MDIDHSLTTWGYIDSTGKYLLKFSPKQYGRGRSFSDGLASVWDPKTKLWGVINTDGKLVLPPVSRFAIVFSEGLAAVDRDRQFGFIDRSSAVKIPYKYSWARDFHEGLAAVSIQKRWGYIRPDGTWLLEPKFEAVGDFHEGKAFVEMNGKYGYIDHDGKMVISPQYLDALDFSEGLAAASTSEVEETWIRNKKRQSFKEALYGYINADGSWAVPPKFIHAEPFSEGLAAVTIFHEVSPAYPGAANGDLEVDERSGFIDKSGNYVIQPNFFAAESFKHGLASVEREFGSSYITHTGLRVWNSQ